MATASLGADYRRLWTASALSNLGDGIRLAALPLLAAAVTRDPVAVAGLAVAQALPWLVFGLPAGAVVDRADRRALLWTVNAARAALLALLAVAVAADRASLPLLYAVAFTLGAGETLHDGAAQAAVAAVVPAAQLERANGRIVAAEVAGNEFVGPPLGGWLFAVGLVLPFAVNAGTLVVATVLVLAPPRVFRPPPAAGAGGRSLRRDVGEGLRWLRGHRLLRTVTGVGAVLVFFDSAWFPILVLYRSEVLGLGEAGFGLLLAVGAVGGILGGLVADRLARRLGSAAALLSAVALAGAAQLALGLTADVRVAAAALLASSLAFAVWNVVSVSLRQRLVPDRLLGRVNSAYRTVVMGAAPLGALLGGAAAGAFGLRAPLLAGAPLLLLVALAGARVVNRRTVEQARAAASTG